MPIENSIQAVLAEMKQFFITRLSLLRSEMNEKGRVLKQAVPILCIASVFVVSGWMALTFALIALLHAIFLPSVFAWLWASLIVGVLYVIFGAGLAQFALGQIKATHLAPTRTLTVLKQDGIWIENEVRTA